MRRAEKKQIMEFIQTLYTAHDEIKKQLEAGSGNTAQGVLGDCQDGAIQLGGLIETAEGEECEVIPMLEEYCELVYQIHEEIGRIEELKANKIYKRLNKQLIQIENSMRSAVKERLEIAFLPYKASMWDSLESVWMAADADENCDAYVVPIPYYDRNPDGSLGQYHYEADEMPDYVQVIHYNNYSLEKRRPDIIYIHNPYDDYNYVTTIDPRYYSRELKKYTDTLVYIPYYSTTGGMSEAQKFCPAYRHADYIIMQAPKFRKFFDPSLPEDKLQAFGSPKFDRIIRVCNNPPEPPAEWKGKMAGRKVYFYNTSINGMLADTESFLKKMKYVFECFEGREDACLLWRPHPLLESTLDSMRPQYKSMFGTLKRYFIEKNLGIYDDTPDMTNTIALCDAYIGDSATSVTSLFGLVGKPLFILDNQIHSAPEEDDWKGRAIIGMDYFGNDNWKIAQGNKLYYSPDSDYKYRYFCDLSGYASGQYYSQVITIGEKHYVCPINARDIIVISNGKIERKILLVQCIEQGGAFCAALSWEKYLVLIPNIYPAIVIYNTENGKISYLDQYLDVFIRNVDGERRIGGVWIQEGYLYLASPADNQMLVINVQTGEGQILALDISHSCGCMMLVPEGDDIWLLPYNGYVITRWNPVSGEIREYDEVPDGLECTHRIHGYSCLQTPFGAPAFCGDYMYLPPQWANMYVRLNKKTGEMEEWKPPMEMPEECDKGYFPSGAKSYFTHPGGEHDENEYHLFSMYDRKLYRINLETEEYSDVPVEFDKKELEEHEPGFMENSEWLQYACEENAFNTLSDFLDGNVKGHAFDRERQIRAYSKVAANNDGTCGEKTHRFISGRLMG